MKIRNRRVLSATTLASVLIASAAAIPLYASEAPQSSMEGHAQYAEGAVKDAWLDGKLETALLFNKYLNPFDIDTDVQSGVVTLNGVVESDIDRDLAGEIAKSVDGISKVDNKLVVDKDKAKTTHSNGYDERNSFEQGVANATLTASIKTKLLVNSNTSGLAVDVDSNQGAVTLSGKVGSEQEKDLIEQIAKNTEGAQSVENRLTVNDSEDAE